MTVEIAKDFSRLPGPRLRTAGRHSGEQFREEHLTPALEDGIRSGQPATIVMSGTEFGCTDAFLDESFGGLVRRHGLEEVRKSLVITGDDLISVHEIDGAMRRAHGLDTFGGIYNPLLGIGPIPNDNLMATLVLAADVETARKWLRGDHGKEADYSNDKTACRYLKSLTLQNSEPSAIITMPNGERIELSRANAPLLREWVIRWCTHGSRIQKEWRTTQPGPEGTVEEADQKLVVELRTSDEGRAELVVEEAAKGGAGRGIVLRGREEGSATDGATIPMNRETRGALLTIAAACMPDAPTAKWPTLHRTTVSDDPTAGPAARRRLCKWADELRTWAAISRLLTRAAEGAGGTLQTAENEQAELHELGLKQGRTEDGSWCVESKERVLKTLPVAQPETIQRCTTNRTAFGLGTQKRVETFRQPDTTAQ